MRAESFRISGLVLVSGFVLRISCFSENLVSFLPTLTSETAPEESRQTFGRIAEMLGGDEPPDVFVQLGHVPAFLEDVFLNFKKFVHGEGKLDAPTRAAIAFAVAAHQKCSPWMQYLAGHARSAGLTDVQIAEVVAVASINATYNAFFKFRGIAGSDAFAGLPVGLRARTLAAVSLDERTVELVGVAIGNLNACQPCVAGHVAKARKLQIDDAAILAAIQCAATILAAVQYANAAGA
jgi:lipoyl-dependent peroxiredoxin subunit D